LFQRGRDVQLPQASEQRKGAPENPIVVSLTSEGKLFLEREPFDEDGLRAALRARLRPEPWKQVLLKADRHLQFAEVRRVLGVLQQAGATGVRLAVQERAR
ncbi:MAG TPA: biopolymer transporter ExbD, partial [Myxococcaceae bacterium]|nr:biopolymer transporter ExbD [Myxococcaceae bacterium]